MKTPSSFEWQTGEYHFTFARVCSDEDTADHYSVMCNEYIFRMTRNENSDEFFIVDEENIPSEIASLKNRLYEVIMIHESKEQLR